MSIRWRCHPFVVATISTTNYRHLHNWCEGLIIINAMGLHVAFAHQSGLVSLDRLVSIVLNLLQTFATDRLVVSGPVNQVPCLVDG